jgi:acylphosphatase
MEIVQVRVVIYGVVQGVGFRHSLSMAARRDDLKGWVRNRSDGAVEALFQGESHKLEKMIRWCQKGSPFSSVEKVCVLWEDKESMYHTFNILF